MSFSVKSPFLCLITWLLDDCLSIQWTLWDLSNCFTVFLTRIKIIHLVKN